MIKQNKNSMMFHLSDLQGASNLCEFMRNTVAEWKIVARLMISCQ